MSKSNFITTTPAPTKNLQMLKPKVVPVSTVPLNMSIEEEEESIFDNKEKELSTEEVLEKQKQSKELSEKMKQLEEEKEKIEEELNKENKIKELYEYFKTPRSEFVFKVTYDDENFRENSIKNYLSAIVKNLGNQSIKILKWKILNNYVWFKTDQSLIIRWVNKRINSRSDLASFNMIQLRPDKFFEYI